MSDLVKARWIGPFEAEIGTVHVPVGTVLDVPRQQAEESGHWEVISGQPAPPAPSPAPAPPTSETKEEK